MINHIVFKIITYAPPKKHASEIQAYNIFISHMDVLFVTGELQIVSRSLSL